MAPKVQFEQLHDETWLAVQAGAGRYPSEVAEELGCTPQAVRRAYRQYELTVEPQVKAGICDPAFCGYWEICLDGPVDAPPPCMMGDV